jgi:hypothetical protein
MTKTWKTNRQNTVGLKAKGLTVHRTKGLRTNCTDDYSPIGLNAIGLTVHDGLKTI